MKKLLALLLVLLFAACASYAEQPEPAPAVSVLPDETGASAETPEIHTSGNYEYIILDNGSAAIQRFTDFFYVGELVIPDTLDGFPVVMIGDSAFENASFFPGVSNPPGVTVVTAFSPTDENGDIIFPGIDLLTAAGSEDEREAVRALESAIESGMILQLNPDSYTISPYGIADIPGITGTAFEPRLFPFGGITGITVPEGVTHIGIFAFSGCLSLSRVTLPDSLTVLDNYAFSGCSYLQEISLPAGLADLGTGVFSDCTSLTAIRIPESVTRIGDNAFQGCGSLTVSVPRDSCAEQYCRDNGVPYDTY